MHSRQNKSEPRRSRDDERQYASNAPKTAREQSNGRGEKEPSGHTRRGVDRRGIWVENDLYERQST